ncbi:PorT family protein [Arenibacter sp. F26102]|uniref:outer membrane beta-barrel protein n=1 Tax=Arenibacter sp. F26102 TaxID=2926416 RepID=UPI001FF5FABA|nr:outer membrane beta-barrel protein [Arenibacter sp. F26102]MCK0147188.1 PorT family protein [Arenibacter sp. F26102]
MKQFLGLTVLLLSFMSVSAQTAIGLKYGVQNTDLYDLSDASSVTASNFGLILNFGYSHLVSFQMEVNYSPKGSVYDNFLDEETEEVYDYLEVPVLLKLSFGANSLKYYGIVGAFAAVPLNISTVTGNVEEKREGIDEVDLGIQFGAGLTYDLGPGRILGEVRYSAGIDGLPDQYTETKALLFSVGYLFTFGKKSKNN